MRNKITYKLKDPKTAKRVNSVISKEKNRKGLWRDKNEIRDKKYREYCERCGAANTQGSWKNKVYASTKSRWQREEEEKGTQKEKKNSVTIKTHTAIILYDKESGACDAYNAEIERKNDGVEEQTIAKIISGRRKIRVKVHKEKIENEKLLEIALKNRAEIYIIDEIM